jgi:hypothetical protein
MGWFIHLARRVLSIEPGTGRRGNVAIGAYGKRDRNAPLPAEQLFAQVKRAAKSPAAAGSKYGPEQLTPRIDTSFDQGKLGWNMETLAELWVANMRSTAAMTYGEIIEHAREITTSDKG